MALRGVSEQEVEEVLASPFARRPGYKGRTNLFKVVGAHRIRVTVVERARLVISVWKERL
jgi:hypothetical protein